MQVPPGGSATLYGVLYQLTRYLHRASAVTIRGLKRGRVSNTVFILEPKGGGGDLREFDPNTVVVEQIKARSGGGSWPLTNVVETVLPDLFVAVEDFADAPSVRYQFLTEGHIGAWGDAYEFFRSLPSPESTTLVLDQLDDTSVIAKTRKQKHTRRSLFRWIAAECSSRIDVQNNDRHHRRVWHFLQRFRIRGGISFTEQHERLRALIGVLSNNPDDADDLIQKGCGWLLDRVTGGEFEIAPRDLLRGIGLPETPFLSWDRIRRTATETSARHVTRRGYDSALDVRQPPITAVDWAANKRIVVIPANSGDGATWQSANLLNEMGSDDALVVWVQTQQDAERTIQIIAESIWFEALGRSSPAPNLSQIANLRVRQAPETPSPWLTVIADEVKSVALARRLVLMPWEDWDARLAMFTTPTIARVLEDEHSDRINVRSEVGSFTPHQLREFLCRKGIQVEYLPSDVFELLLKPIIAGIFVRVANDATWVPRTEYEICDRYWSFVLRKGDQIEHPADIDGLRNLVRQLRSDPTYPWPAATLREAHIDDDARQRLEKIGWLHRPDNTETAAIWHDRLLNWAIAESTVQDLTSLDATASDHRKAVTSLLTQVCDLNIGGKIGRAGYVLGDILWMLTKRDLPESIDIASSILEHLDSKDGYGHYCERRYIDLLSTLGPQVIPLLERCLRNSLAREWNPIPRYVAESLIRVAWVSSEDCDRAAAKWLRDESDVLQEAAGHYFERRPSADVTDLLWKRHRAIAQRLDEEPFESRPHNEYSEGNRRMRAAVEHQPEWVLQAIDAAHPDDPAVWELGWLLAASPVGAADKKWTRVKEKLFSLVDESHARASVACILRFQDHDERDRLAEWIRSGRDSTVKSFAYGTLAVLDPDRALEEIRAVPAGELYMTRYHWLPLMLTLRPDSTRERIREIVHESDADSIQGIRCYQGNEHLMDAATLRAFLLRLEPLIDLESNRTQDDKHHYLFIPLSMLKVVDSPECLIVFREFSDSPIASKLADLAVKWSKEWQRSYHHHELNDALFVLLRIGGNHLTKVVLQELDAPQGERWHIGTEWAPLADQSPDILKRLRRISTELEGADDPSTDLKIDVGSSIQALLAAGDIEPLVRCIELDTHLTFIGSDDPFLRADLSSVSEDQLNRMLEVSRSRGPEAWAVTSFLAATKRAEAIDRLRETLYEIETDFEAAPRLLCAYRFAGGMRVEDIPRISQFLDRHETCGDAVNLLLDVDRAKAIEAFAFATRNGIGCRRWAIAGFLCQEEDGRTEILGRLANEILEDPNNFYASSEYEVVGNSEDPRIQELLIRLSHDTSVVSGATLNAIRGLAIRDLDMAFREVIVAWERWDSDREMLPCLILDIDTHRGPGFLVNRLGYEEDFAVRDTIGLELRLHLSRDEMESLCRSRLSNPETESRDAAAFLARFIPGTDDDEVGRALGARLKVERAISVRDTIIESIHVRHRERLAVALISRQESDSNSHLDSLLAALRLAGPDLARARGDVLGFMAKAVRLPNSHLRLLNDLMRKLESDLTNEYRRKSRQRR